LRNITANTHRRIYGGSRTTGKFYIEHVIVANGEMEIFFNDTWHRLKQNEGLHFNAAEAHGYRNVTKKNAIFHNIIHYNESY
jgi:glyoxylate utilization-related uncharacterized protein